jgi:16S rRNA (guanine966-N2)-methyltransferase
VLGLEALSRGASEVHLVERDPRAIRSLRVNIGELGATPVTVHAVDAFEFLQNVEPLAQDVIFLDPPYAFESLEALCGILASRGWVAPGASIYIEQSAWAAPLVLPQGWTVRRQKKAGNVRYSLIDVAAA